MSVLIDLVQNQRFPIRMEFNLCMRAVTERLVLRLARPAERYAVPCFVFETQGRDDCDTAAQPKRALQRLSGSSTLRPRRPALLGNQRSRLWTGIRSILMTRRRATASQRHFAPISRRRACTTQDQLRQARTSAVSARPGMFRRSSGSSAAPIRKPMLRQKRPERLISCRSTIVPSLPR